MSQAMLPLEDSPMLLDEAGPVFVMGCPRSGTTFVADLLAGLHGVEVFVGVLAPPRMMHLAGSMPPGADREELMASIRDVFWQSFWRRAHFRNQRVIQVLSGNEPLRSLWQNPGLGGRLFCYKEPFLCFAAEPFARTFGRARFIHIVRDGRDNAASMVRSYPHALSDEVLRSDELTFSKNSEIGRWRRHGDFNLPWWLPAGEEEEFVRLSRFGRYLRLWREMVERASSIETVCSAERYLEVRYEHLVTSPQEEGKRILAFLHRAPSGSFGRRLRAARPDSLGNWTRMTEAGSTTEIHDVAGALLSKLGYAVD